MNSPTPNTPDLKVICAPLPEPTAVECATRAVECTTRAVEGATSAVEYATRAEESRLHGNYSLAVKWFTEAIEKNPRYAWAHAHRGAARAALGNFPGSSRDFKRAEASGYQGAAWLHAQKGELCRLWARAIMSSCLGCVDESAGPEPDEFMTAIEYLYPGHSVPRDPAKRPFLLMAAAIHQFSRSLDKRPGNSWVLAHRGAVYTMRNWIGRLQHPGPQAEAQDFELARKDFTDALHTNPAYGWAHAFLGVLLGLNKQLHPALEHLAQAQMNGLDRQLSIMRILMELLIYAGGDDASILASGVQTAWQALQIDSEEIHARYFVADGMSLGGHPEAPAARQRARMALHDTRARLLAMEGGLDCLDGNFEAARKILGELKEHRDLEALSLVKRDPAWKSVREPASSSAREPASRGVLAPAWEALEDQAPRADDVLRTERAAREHAHAAYKDLFNF